MNMRLKAQAKYLSRGIFQLDLNGPMTVIASVDASWKAELRAIVTNEAGHTQ
jgi:hypothetical protein